MGLVGLVMTGVGFGGPIEIALNLDRVHFFDIALGCLFFALGLAGVDLMIQALRQAPWNEGFFLTGVHRLTRGHPAAFVSLGVPLLIVLMIVGTAVTGDAQGLEAALCFGAMWLGFLMSTAIHEGGHALAARLGGLVVMRVIVPPLELALEASGWRFRLTREWMSPFAGRVLYKIQPPITPRQQIVLAAGGPCGNLVLLLAVLTVNPYDGSALSGFPSPGAVLVVSILGGSLLLFLSNLVPFRHPLIGIGSDGAVILDGIRRLRKQ